MSDSHAEALDPSVLGEQVGDDELAAADYPPDQPLAVDDPSIIDAGVIARDDVSAREGRLTPEVDDSVTRPAAERLDAGLIDTNVSPDGNDHEERLIADEGGPDLGPEAAALHVESN